MILSTSPGSSSHSVYVFAEDQFLGGISDLGTVNGNAEASVVIRSALCGDGSNQSGQINIELGRTHADSAHLALCRLIAVNCTGSTALTDDLGAQTIQRVGSISCSTYNACSYAECTALAPLIGSILCTAEDLGLCLVCCASDSLFGSIRYSGTLHSDIKTLVISSCARLSRCWCCTTRCCS